MLEDGLSFPFDGENTAAQFIIGSVLWFFHWLLIPLIIITGYHLASIRAVTRGERKPPAFDDWGTYTIDGLKYIAVWLLYSLLPLIPIVLFIIIAFGTEGTAAIAGVLLALAALTSFVVSYTLPGATTELATSQSIRDSMDISHLADLWLSRQYLVAVAIAFFSSIILNVAYGMLIILTFGIGILFTPVVYFYYFQFLAYIFGDAYREVYEEPSTESM